MDIPEGSRTVEEVVGGEKIVRISPESIVQAVVAANAQLTALSIVIASLLIIFL